ncbi:hypothetical protein V1477_013051 [Vespula maculifrons]|uniref:Uncharacterized protein n=1 Tax=Vespula maculifrons TaxID=7453 RepID=A0ABD2BUT6_VESMC
MTQPIERSSGNRTLTACRDGDTHEFTFYLHIFLFLFCFNRFDSLLTQKYEMDNRQIENKKKYEQKETRREMMARKRLYLRQLFQKEFIEQEKLLRQIGYALIPTRP